MEFILKIQLGSEGMQTNTDVHHAIVKSLLGHWTAFQGQGSLIDGHAGTIANNSGDTVGKWEVTAGPIIGCDACDTELPASEWKSQFCPKCGHDSRS